MTNKKVEKWLGERGIKLEESFPMALKRLSKAFQKESGIKNIEDVYSLLGFKKPYIIYLQKNSNSVQSKKLQTKYCY